MPTSRRPSPFRLTIIIGVALVAVGSSLFFLSRERDTDQAETRTAVSRLADEESRLVRKGLRQLEASRGLDLPPLAPESSREQPMPSKVRKAVLETMGPVSHLRLDFAHARFVGTSPVSGLWIVEGRGVTCGFKQNTGTSTCATTVSARRQGLMLGTYRPASKAEGGPKHFEVLGVVPAGVHAVKVSTGQSTRTIAVTEHFYTFKAKKPIFIRRLIRRDRSDPLK